METRRRFLTDHADDEQRRGCCLKQHIEHQAGGDALFATTEKDRPSLAHENAHDGESLISIVSRICSVLR
jgi:hypothetical protein